MSSLGSQSHLSKKTICPIAYYSIWFSSSLSTGTRRCVGIYPILAFFFMALLGCDQRKSCRASVSLRKEYGSHVSSLGSSYPAHLTLNWRFFMLPEALPLKLTTLPTINSWNESVHATCSGVSVRSSYKNGRKRLLW